MAILQSTTISGSNANTGSLQVTGSTVIFPLIESSLTSSFSGSGKMWINADTQNIQYSIQTSLGTVNSPARFLGTWSATNPLITARTTYGAGAGSQNAGLVFGGAPALTCTEEYDGSVFTAGGALSTGRRTTGAGTQNAAIAAGGATPTRTNATEEYNGSSWSSGGNTGNTFTDRNVAGFQNAAIAVGGVGNSPYPVNNHTEEYNGASWSSGTASPNNSFSGIGRGTQNDMISLPGGQNNSAPAYGSTREVDFYNGSAWTVGPDSLICAIGGGGAGDANQTMIYSSQFTANGNRTNEWNGSTWVEGDCLNIDLLQYSAGMGTQAAALGAGGYNPAIPSVVGNAYEYTKNYIPPYTSCVWTVGGGLINGRYGGKGGGTTNAGLVFAGVIAPARVSCTEEYDGSVYAAGGAMITARNNLAGGGTQNAGIAAGGEPTNDGRTEEYNGSSWSTGGSMSNGGYGMSGNGTQDKFIAQSKQPATTNSEKYNGTSWSATNAMNIARVAHGFIGDSDGGIILGGSPFSPVGVQTEEWDGTNYSSGPNLIFCTRDPGAGGTSNDGLAFGGYNPANPVGHYRTQAYNGVAFSIANPTTYAYKVGQGNATPGGAVGSFHAGGYNPSASPYGAGNTTQLASCCSTTLCSIVPVWSGAASLITGRQYLGGAGTTSAGLVFGGNVTPDTSTCTEEYDGSSWTAGGALINPIANHSGAGSQNAALSIGGYAPGGPHPDAPGTIGKTEEYNGSTWSAGGTLNQVIFEGDSAGTQNAALSSHGRGAAPTYSNLTCTQEYDGSSWTAGGNAIYARSNSVGTGTQNAALSVGGDRKTCVEEYDGSSWSTGGTLIIAGNSQGGAGTQNDSVVFGGDCYPGTVTNIDFTQNYDGTSWAYGPNMLTAKRQMAISNTGTGTSAFAAGGRDSGTSSTNTQLYNRVINTCIGTWSLGGNMITATDQVGGAGTRTAALAIGGRAPSATTKTEEYNGTNWSVGGAMSGARYTVSLGFGTQNAAGATGGGPTAGCLTEHYDGTSWSSGGTRNCNQNSGGSSGTQNAAFYTAGYLAPANRNFTENYDGTTWTNSGALSTPRYNLAVGGSQNSGFAAGGNVISPTNHSNITEEYNGSTWSTGGNLNFSRRSFTGFGTSQEGGTVIGGFTPAYLANNERYNGYVWSLDTPMLQKKQAMGAAKQGTFTSALVFGGGQAPDAGKISTTEEFECGSNQIAGAGLQCWIANVTMETE